MADVNQVFGETFPQFMMKTPQLIGIIAGCLVFCVTIAVVFYLLYASGSFSKLAAEMSGSVTPLAQQSDKCVVVPQFLSQPQLYDELLHARKSLPLKPSISALHGKSVILRPYIAQADFHELQLLSDGRAIFHESAYDPARLSGWFQISNEESTDNPIIATALKSEHPDGSHICIVDAELGKIIGSFSLIRNCPQNLSIGIDLFWLTPAFQGKKRGHEAMLLILQWLCKAGYRRITAEVDDRHVIGRRFLARCGFQCEAVLRKHKILHQRNSNTALYVLLNSDCEEVERRLKTYLGLPLTQPMHKVAQLESSEGTSGRTVAAMSAAGTPAVAVGGVGAGSAGGGGRSSGVNTAGGESASHKRNEKKKAKRKEKANRVNITW